MAFLALYAIYLKLIPPFPVCSKEADFQCQHNLYIFPRSCPNDPPEHITPCTDNQWYTLVAVKECGFHFLCQLFFFESLLIFD